MKEIQTSRINKTKGIGFIEFLIVLPILIILIFYAIEFGRALRIHSTMNVLARGLASSTFRDCSNITLSASLQSCLDGVINSTSSSATNLLPNAFLKVSLYKWDNSRTFPNEPTLVGVSPITPSNPASRFTTSYFAYANNPERNTMLKENGIIVYSEVFSSYNSILPIIPNLFGLSNNMFYVAAAY